MGRTLREDFSLAFRMGKKFIKKRARTPPKGVAPLGFALLPPQAIPMPPVVRRVKGVKKRRRR